MAPVQQEMMAEKDTKKLSVLKSTNLRPPHPGCKD